MRRALAILALARAYEVYENEYANDVLPGGRGDDDLPNLPYAVDANRYSDGVSSVSPLTDTAPAFPLHRGAVSDAPAGRRRLALAKVQSEIEQGVAAAGDGEYVRERRVAETLERLAANPGAAPATSFWVNASLRWNPSGFAIQSNETYRIEVRGHQRWVAACQDRRGHAPSYDAISVRVAAGRCRAYLGAKRRLLDANWFELVCGVGEYVWRLQEQSDGQGNDTAAYMPLREAEVTASLFRVGSHLDFTATHDGELVCFANDADWLYWNNEGQLRVDVTKRWPPVRSDLPPARFYGGVWEEEHRRRRRNRRPRRRPRSRPAIRAVNLGGIRPPRENSVCASPRGGADRSPPSRRGRRRAVEIAAAGERRRRRLPPRYLNGR